VVWVAVVPVPVMVNGYVPGGVVADVETVSVELAPAVTAVGLKLALAPAGRPAADRVTVCGEPDVTAVLMVVVVLAPLERGDRRWSRGDTANLRGRGDGDA
jgi:hypothetical protein